MTKTALRANKSTPEKLGGALLELNQVAVHYDGEKTPASISDIDFRLCEGETVLFLGPSGCGKSTLAMVCGNLIPSAVEAHVQGDVWRSPELLQPGAIGYVFQDADAQFCMLHADDEVAFGLENCLTPRAEMPDRIRAAMTKVNLLHVHHEQHDTFSGGMKQKLAIASALAMDAKLLIFDEPTANLDPMATGQVFRLITDLRKQGRTMIVIEHKFDALLSHTDRVVLMNREGRIHRVGKAQEVLREEWDWMMAQGVVSPWKSRPGASPLQTENGESLIAGTPQPFLSKPEPTTVVQMNHGLLRYGDRTVWRDVSVRIQKGAFVAVVGPNGAGKSSLLQVMAGLQKVTEGQVHLLGQPMDQWKTANRMKAISYCFQNPEYQFIFERVADELSNGMVGDDLPPSTLELLRAFGLEHCGSQSPFGLSQGQKRRLSVASMLRQDHELYFLDEPTYGQDAHTQQIIMDCLTSLRDREKTIVMTTHDMDLVQRYATHVLVLCDEGVQFFGSPAQLFAQPDLLRMAHLLDDVLLEDEGSISFKEQGSTADIESAMHVNDVQAGHTGGWLIRRLNPPVHLVTCMLAIAVTVFAQNMRQSVGVFVLPICLMFALAWMTPWQVFKRLTAFLGFYVLYVWSLTAYAKITPGTPTLDFLWMHLSLPGFRAGLVLAFRMLGAVCFGILFVSNTDVTDLIVGLCKNFRLSPKISYGLLAGIRFAPLFRTEWVKLKQARQLRGKDAKWSLLRPVTYALPLLSQAVRMSERVAVAMEARGFQGPVATQASARTFYRNVRIRWWDYLYGVAVMAVSLSIIIVFR